MALRDWLWEAARENAKGTAFTLEPGGAGKMNILLARQIERLRPKLLRRVVRRGPLAADPPQGNSENLMTHTVFHSCIGLKDDVIPYTESLGWKRKFPRPYLKEGHPQPEEFSHVRYANSAVAR